MSYGIDTIKVGYTVLPEHIDFNHWTRTEKVFLDNEEDILVKDYYTKEHKTPNGTMIFLKYVCNDYTGRNANLLVIEFSLPNLINGCNYLDVTDMELALDYANATLANIEGIPALPDIREATLYRIDLCANFQVGEYVCDYIYALGKAHMPRRKAKCYSNTGVQFRSSEITTTLYDKEKECGNENAHGILRFEISIRKKRKINAYLGMKDATLGKISFELIHERIQAELTLLSLDKPILSDRAKVESILSSVYTSKARVLRLLGYWDTRQTMTREQMAEHGYGKSSMRNSEKLLAGAGISVNGNLGMNELPALMPLLVREEKIAEEYQIMSCIPSDTRKIDQLSQLWFLSHAYMRLPDEDNLVFYIPADFAGKVAVNSKLILDKSPPH